MKCPHCGQEHPDDNKFCPETGQKISLLKSCQNKECKNFGKYNLQPDAQFCPECGCSVEDKKPLKLWKWILFSSVALMAIIATVIFGVRACDRKDDTIIENNPIIENDTLVPNEEIVEGPVFEAVSGISGSYVGHDYVDLGLSVKWATCNVGASIPEEYGYYFAWGETSPKANYSEESSTFTECPRELSLADDAAQVNWGGDWRMPTAAECEELENMCDYTWCTHNGKKGVKIKSRINGKSIFLPAAGYRCGTQLTSEEDGVYCWTSSADEDPFVDYLHFGEAEAVGYDFRCNGLPVRPVCP